MPVEAPEGTAALKTPSSVVTSASTVGLPRESRISRAKTFLMVEKPQVVALLVAAKDFVRELSITESENRRFD